MVITPGPLARSREAAACPAASPRSCQRPQPPPACKPNGPTPALAEGVSRLADARTSTNGDGRSAHGDGVLPARDQLADDRVAGQLAGDEQAAGGLGVGEQEQLVVGDDASRCGRTQSRLRRLPPGT